MKRGDPNHFLSTVSNIHANSDPLYSAQSWVYDQINVLPVWEEGIFGTGVRVRINDEPILTSHPEFEGKFDWNASCGRQTRVKGSNGESGYPGAYPAMAAVLAFPGCIGSDFLTARS